MRLGEQKRVCTHPPIRLNTFNFSIKLQFNHGFKSLKNISSFSLSFNRKYPSVPGKGINKGYTVFMTSIGSPMRASPGAAVKLCLGDLLVMGSNPETASLHMQG